MASNANVAGRNGHSQIKKGQEVTDMSEKTVTGAENVRWDLSCMYAGLDDPQIDLDVTEAERLMAAFSDEFKGRLNVRLGDALERYAELTMLLNKVYCFLHLSKDVDLRVEVIKTKQRSIEERLARMEGEFLTFFDIELSNLDEADVQRQAEENPLAAKHLPMIKQMRLFKPHLLTEDIESALAKREPFGPSSWSSFYDEVESDLRFEFDDRSQTLSEMLTIAAYDPDGERRAEALHLIHEGLGGHFLKFATQTLNIVARSKGLETMERHYQSPMASRNMGNRMPDEVVNSLHEAVSETAGPLSRRYYAVKAAILGRKTLRWSDRNAPLPFKSDVAVTWDEARDIVIRAYSSFSPTLATLVARMFDERRIDAPLVEGKRSGAYCMSLVLPGNVPLSFNLLNFEGRDSDVRTMAHELGHAVHGLLAAKTQGVLQMHAPMAYAETASIFGEMVTFDFLLSLLRERGDKEAMLALLCEAAEDFLNSVVRQIGFSNFERRVHDAGRRLSPEEMNAIWMETVYELYGRSDEVFTYEDAERLWAYVSHFHRPFYVYAYAAGKLFTDSLYALRERFGDRFEPMYLEILRAGSTKDANELLAPFGLKPDREFWDSGIMANFGRLLDEIERLAAELGFKID